MKTSPSTIDGIDIPIGDIRLHIFNNMTKAHWGAFVSNESGGRVVAFGGQGLTAAGGLEHEKGFAVYTNFLTRLKSEGLNILARMPLPDVQNPHWWILVLDTCDLNHVRSLLNPIVRNIKSSPYFDAQLPISEKVCDI
jgi:hypothetical protein